jgi:xanthine dehydrogenase accessory factor
VALDFLGGSAFLDAAGASHVAGADSESLLESLQQEAAAWPAWRFRHQQDAGRMFIGIPPQTRALVCGAGPDAVPVVRQLCQLDWRVSIADHRAAFARADRFPGGCEVVCCRPERLSDLVDLGTVNAVVIMSHHLENDAAYLRHFNALEPTYIGALGPRARRNRLCEMAAMNTARVHGPAGLDIAAELPEAIALSIVAEIHAELNGRDGQSLTLRE